MQPYAVYTPPQNMQTTASSFGLDALYAGIISRIEGAIANRPHARLLLAIAGPPGSGKSSIAADLVNRINARSTGATAAAKSSANHAISISMQGFQFPRSYLDRVPNRSKVYDRHDAPWTFDVDAIVRFVRKLRASSSLPVSTRRTIEAPSLDQTLGITDTVHIPPEVSIIVLEGDYLLLDASPWSEINDLVDLKIFVDVDARYARARVAYRYLLAGVESTMEQALDRFDQNDALNGDLVRMRLGPCDLQVDSFDTSY